MPTYDWTDEDVWKFMFPTPYGDWDRSEAGGSGR